MSKELELFKNIEKALAEKYELSIGAYENLIHIEKSLKALEIIKEKRVNVNWLFVSFENYQQYQQALENGWTISIQVSSTPLTQEEYDLLKEELLNGR